jgi:single-strand DNA-binding protein
MSVNKVFLLGNLGKDPEVRYTPNQVAVSTFSMATTDRRKDNTGNWVDQTEWHNIVVFGQTAENCAKYLKKGRQAFIEGKIQTRKWQDKEGKDRYTTEIVADRVQFVGGNKSDRESGYSSPTSGLDAPSTSPAANFGNLKTADSLASDEVSFEEDDIPF